MLAFPLDVELGAHPEPSVLVCNDRRATFAGERLVAAGVVDVPMRIEQSRHGRSPEPLMEQSAQVARAFG